MSETQMTLAALIGSRICHDLISPIGAINNGLELLNMSGTADGPELDLIGESVGNASARIRYFRIAFGAAGDQMVGQNEVQLILGDLYDSSRIKMSWVPTTPQPRISIRLAFLSILCLETALPYGGAITVTMQDGGAWTAIAQGDRMAINDDLWDLLGAPKLHPDLLPSQVQFALLPIIAGDEGRLVKAHATEGGMQITF